MSAPAHLGGLEGRYRVGRLLGEGSRKSVHVARDTWLDREVALASVRVQGLTPEQRARLLREAQTLARLGDHPHVVTVHDFGETEDRVYLVTEYLAGGTLEDSLRQSAGQGLPIDKVCRIAIEVSGALTHVHAAGIVHRDVKPANVWLTASGVAKLGDFGLATARDGVRLTDEGLVLGTVAYMAPEQAVGGAVEPRSDLYALGVLLYELVTGRLPFLGDDAVAVVHQQLHAAPVAPSWRRADVPPLLEVLILRLLAKNPHDRPHAAEVGAVLAARDNGAGARPAAAEPRNPLDRLAGDVFVGREVELEQLQAAVEEARAGRGRLIAIAGDPGIGKTRLLDELTTYARLRQTQVVRGRCYEGGGAPPLWPWVQVLRTLVATRDRETLRAWLGVAADDIALWVPAARTQLSEIGDDALPTSDQDRFRLFDSVAMVLRAFAGERPLVVVLDDLHGADVPSLMLLGFLAGELAEARVLLVVAYRDGEVGPDHPLRGVLREAARAPATGAIALGGMSEVEVGRLMAHTVGSVPGAELVTAVWKETEGNPLFVIEVVRLLVAEQRLHTPGARGIPATVRTVIGQRLARLAPETLEILLVAAAVGREFDGSVVEGVVGGSIEGPLSEATAARVVVSAGPTDRYRFTHALMRETLYDSLSATRRPALHRAIAAVLENTPDARLSELALHLAEAGPDLATRAIACARRAAEQALVMLAFEEAERLYQVALSKLTSQSAADERERTELLLAIAAAQGKSGAFAAARTSYESAAISSRRAGDAQLLARAAIGIGEVGHHLDIHDAPAIALVEEALGGLGDTPSPLRAIAQTTLALWLRAVEPERSYHLAREAMASARQFDTPTLGFALRQGHFVMWGPDVNPRERLAISSEIQHLGRHTGDRNLEAEGSFRKIFDLLEIGDLQTFEFELAAYELLGTALRQAVHTGYAALFRNLLALVRGRASEALRWAEQTLATSERTHGAQRALVPSLAFTAHLECGRLEEAAASLSRARTQIPLADPNWRCALAYVHAARGDTTAARRELEALAADDFRCIPRTFNWIPSACILAMACAALDDRPRAAILYEQLRPHAELHACGALPICTLGATSRYLGLLAVTLQRHDEAVAYFEDALARNRSMNARPWLAFTQHDYAALLLRRAGAGDVARAATLLDEAAAIAADLDMGVLREQVRDVRDRAAATPSTDIPLPLADDRVARYVALRSTQELRRAEILAGRPAAPAAGNRFPEILGRSDALGDVLHLMAAAAGSSMPVVVEGETGVGKELVARGIHRVGSRCAGTFVAVNCAAIPDHLLESELFGHRRGAFTGAAVERIGHFEAASGGTLFLDEIGEMPATMQAKLLRVLQEGEVLRLGESRPRSVDVRVISATNRDLAAQVAAGRFREDLYFRLAGFPIQVPPLRERRDDIPTLVEHFVRVAATGHAKPPPTVTPTARERLVRHDWPGNVRELQHVMQRAVALVNDGEAIDTRHLSMPARLRPGRTSQPPAALDGEPEGSLRGARDAFEASYIADVLREQGGNVSRAANVLGLSRAMLHRKLRKYGIH